jgi:ribosomal protein S18 acetylase RimI-like enzyme
METALRPAEIADAAAIARVHVLTWQVAYRGIMPDAFLDALQIADRVALWHESLTSPKPGHEVLVWLRAGAVAGFVAFGPGREDSTRGEVYALYVVSEAWDTGAGRALLEAASARLAATGFASALLWVAAANARARRFYERAGWSADGAAKSGVVLGVTVDEVRYARAFSEAKP